MKYRVEQTSRGLEDLQNITEYFAKFSARAPLKNVYEILDRIESLKNARMYPVWELKPDTRKMVVGDCDFY